MIKQMSLVEQSAFFARASSYCYNNLEFMKTQYKNHDVKYYGNKGSDAYVLEDDENVIVVCRGTEVKQIADVKADLSISKTDARVGKIHIGFNHYVDKIWPGILARGVDAKKNGKMLWLTGHSLGAAMATLMAYRFATYDLAATPEALFTYGSPRVGNRKFVNFFNTLPFEHHRWVNDGDIVTKIPFAPFFYHCGTMHHISSGAITMNYERTFNPLKLLGLTSPRSILNMIMSDAKDHSSDKYRIYLTAATVA